MRRFLKGVAVAVASVLAVLGVHGAFVEPRLILDERRYEVAIPGLDVSWSHATVAVFSDLQVGMWLANVGMIERVVDAVVEADPAVVLIAGDFVYHSNPPVDTVMELLAPLAEADIPVFAVLGNHDHASGAAEEVAAALERYGFEVLRNEAVPLRHPDVTGGEEPLYVVGLESHRFGDAAPAEALDEVPDGAPRIVVMHNPASFPALPASSAPLAVAGHTHCGQIAVPGTPKGSYLELPVEERIVVDGFSSAGYGAAGNRLFVTCGIGFSLVPIRINAAPQLVFFDLVPQ